ncbi:MAG: DoxX [halophilic archaeon J07HX64]|nr:MAG: DoxX [halophilic archaeon J07HX64]
MWQALVFVTLLCQGAGAASAHVKYVTDGDGTEVGVGEFFAAALGEPLSLALLTAGGIGAVAVAGSYLRYATRLPDVQVGIRTLRSYRPYLGWMLRLSIGLPLVGAGFAGYYFSPSVPAELRLLQVILGFALLFGLATRLVAAAGLVAYLAGLATNFPELLLASEFVGGFLGIIVIGPGQPSADMLLRRVAVTDGTFLSRFRGITTPGKLLNRVGLTHELAPILIRAGLGLNFVYLGVSQKWLQPAGGLEVVEQYGLTNVVPVSPELWVFGAGLVEFGIGVLFLAGCFTRGAAVAGFVVLTMTLFGLSDDPVLAHITLFGLTSALMVTGSGRYSLDDTLVPWLHRRLTVDPDPADTATITADD